MAEMQKNVAADDKVSELTEEDVAVSYIGDELDLKTVGDIIAIIEEKVKRTPNWFHILIYCISFSANEINSGPSKVSKKTFLLCQ